MVSLLALWLPIVVSAVLVFVASSAVHMLFGYHANDYAALPDEDGVGAALQRVSVPPGAYMMPHAATASAMSSPEYMEKLNRGPVAMLTVRRPGPVNMARILVAWFVYLLVVSIVAGYVASRAVGPSADFASVFRFAGTIAFAAYALGTWSESIWFWRKWSTTVKNTADGILYALITGAIFAWLWPTI